MKLNKSDKNFIHLAKSQILSFSETDIENESLSLNILKLKFSGSFLPGIISLKSVRDSRQDTCHSDSGVRV